MAIEAGPDISTDGEPTYAEQLGAAIGHYQAAHTYLAKFSQRDALVPHSGNTFVFEDSTGLPTNHGVRRLITSHLNHMPDDRTTQHQVIIQTALFSPSSVYLMGTVDGKNCFVEGTIVDQEPTYRTNVHNVLEVANIPLRPDQIRGLAILMTDAVHELAQKN